MGQKVRISKYQQRISKHVEADLLTLLAEVEELKRKIRPGNVTPNRKRTNAKRRRTLIHNLEKLWAEVKALREQVRKAETRRLH
jgi:hypothetical protein